MACLISVGRALLNSDLEKLNKETKNAFYEKLKTLYSNETYFRRIQGLTTEANYLLTHSALWIIQHLVRISSSEHKAVTTIRKTFYGLVTIKTLAGAAFKAGSELFLQGKLPDDSIVEDLKKAYESGKKAFGIKNLPRLWYELLEETESVLIDPKLSVGNLEKVNEIIKTYEVTQNKINELLVKTRINDLSQDTREFAFGFVRQLTDVVMDHPQPDVRRKAFEILTDFFKKDKQDKNVRLLILTTLQNIIDKKMPDLMQDAGTMKKQFEQYPCLSLLPEDSKLLDDAKAQLLVVAQGKQPLPMSKFVYGSRDIKIFKEKVTVGGNFAPKGPEPITPEELQRVVEASKSLHIVAFERNRGQVTLVTIIGNIKKTIFHKEVNITGDFIN
jgi:hypothetical protein